MAEGLTPAAMEVSALSPNGFDEFLQTGRTGRRNALPDILSENSKTSTADLSCKMEKLDCSGDASANTSNASTSGEMEATSSQEQATGS